MISMTICTPTHLYIRMYIYKFDNFIHLSSVQLSIQLPVQCDYFGFHDSEISHQETFFTIGC